MKKPLIFILLLYISLSLLTSCGKRDIPETFSLSGELFNGLEFDYNSDDLIVSYSNESMVDERTIKQPEAFVVFQKLNSDSLQEIIGTAELSEKYVYLWFKFGDGYELENSGGTFGMYENDIVIWSASPIVSHCIYYKAPEGTYNALKEYVNSIT